MDAKRFSLFSKSSLFVMISSAGVVAILLPLIVPAQLLGLLIGLSVSYYYAKMDNQPYEWGEFLPSSFTEVGIIAGGAITGVFILPLLLPLHFFGAIFGFTASMTVLTSVNNFHLAQEDQKKTEGKENKFTAKFGKLTAKKEAKVEQAQNLFFLARVLGFLGKGAKSILETIGVPVNKPGASSSNDPQK